MIEHNKTFSLPATNTIEENAKIWAENASANIKPGHGFFFEFKRIPELKKAVLDYFVNVLGWKLEYKNTFLRKPMNKIPIDIELNPFNEN